MILQHEKSLYPQFPNLNWSSPRNYRRPTRPDSIPSSDHDCMKCRMMSLQKQSNRRGGRFDFVLCDDHDAALGWRLREDFQSSRKRQEHLLVSGFAAIS